MTKELVPYIEPFRSKMALLALKMGHMDNVDRHIGKFQELIEAPGTHIVN